MNSISLFPNKQRSGTAIALLSSMIVLQLFMEARAYYLKSNLPENYTFRDLEVINLDMVIGMTSFALLILYILTIIFYLRWFKRAYRNITELVVKTRYSKNMAAGAWFIPVFHWIGPIQMMIEIYRNTERILIENSLTKKKKSRYIIVFAWWFLYVLAGLSSILNFTVIQPDLNKLETIPWMDSYLVFVNVLNLVLTVLAILVVNNYRKMEIKLPEVSFIVENKNNQSEEIIDEGIIDKL